MKIVCDEVLNDLHDYFLLADLELLDTWRVQRGIDADLATEFTTTDSVDDALAAGVLLPMRGIENYPYTVVFRLGDAGPELDDDERQFLRDGYRLQVRNGRVSLFTWPILHHFDDETVRSLLERHSAYHGPTIGLDNGLYDVAVLGGVRQESGAPTLEFVFAPADQAVELPLPDVLQPFSISVSA